LISKTISSDFKNSGVDESGMVLQPSAIFGYSGCTYSATALYGNEDNEIHNIRRITRYDIFRFIGSVL